MERTKKFSLASIVLAAGVAHAGEFHNISPDMPMMCYQGDLSAPANISQDLGSCIIYDCTIPETGQFLQGQACEKPGADNPTHIELDKVAEQQGSGLPISMGYQGFSQRIGAYGHVEYEFPMFFDTVFSDGFRGSPFQ